ncbi:MAG: hypothetical protein WEA36_02720 [Balneolaceae bacterium]
MKMYRSLDCRISVWLNLEKRDCEQLQRAENYPFNVRSIKEPNVLESVPDATFPGNVDQVLVKQEDQVVLREIPKQEEERFDARKIVSVLLG